MAPNTFVWYDLMTPDLQGAAAFYKSAIGWKTADSGLPDRAYTLCLAGDAMVAGLMAAPENMRDAPAAWNGHVGIDDADAFVERVTVAGGKLHRPVEDIPKGIGRFAVVADPHGAVFILFEPGPMPEGQAAPVQPPPGTPGHIGWCELHAGDWSSAFDFYAALFDWTKAEAVDMGPMGTYQTFAAGGSPIGGIMTKMPEAPAPYWIFYINVDSVEAALERIVQAGGKPVMGPRQVPGGSWILQALDPQGALFAVTSMVR